MKIDLKVIQKELLSGSIFLRAGYFFGHNIKRIVFLMFFLSSVYCGYIWYIFIYNPQWSEEKEAQYLKTKDKEVTFNRKKFQDIVEKEKKRAQEYEKTVGEVNDIFRINRPKTEQPAQELSPAPETQPVSPL